ncbi:septum formation protein [Anaerocolumna jejuensis DSM 15929]|uniref:dTTP/UTP pyrophosphatase n=1 Tax=Anaerocolumna jejuensis DSM 15929 TaxID=1121322 RepID=A0A1M6MQ26_9FIRM|nr:Maf family protein [Anaerocolumna jejuensis]SHJ85529.1 septum formation protein [Anaerocolumna jejuensis DSM 15929]
MYKIILASGSPRRKEILEQAGVDFVIKASNAEEITDKTNPPEMVEDLARLKAEEIKKKEEGEFLIISADTLVFLDGSPLGKPKGREDAYHMLSSLSGRKHEVYTGVAIIIREKRKAEKELVFHQMSRVEVETLSKEQIEAYISSGEPFDKAGAYAIQGKFAVHISGIEGEYNNIVGLPIARIYHELLKEGIDILKK